VADQYIGLSIAGIIVTASIILAGILIGVGRAFQFKRLENFGIDELFQSVINAAIIGAFASIIVLISGISSTLVSIECAGENAPGQLSCTLGQIKESLFNLFSQTLYASNVIGYYQSLVLNFNTFSIQPFANLSSVSNVLSSQLFTMQLLLMLLELNVQILTFVEQNALLLLLPIGLVLRTLFATRRVGGFLIALAIGLYVLFPAFIMIFPNPEADLINATNELTNFTNNSIYATMPIVDLNDNYAIAGKLDLMSGRCSDNLTNSSLCANYTKDYPVANSSNSTNSTSLSPDFTGDLTLISQSNSDSISKVLLYSVVAPLLSFLLTIVFVKEFGDILGSEISLSTFSSI
jgi:hypothetical protein